MVRPGRDRLTGKVEVDETSVGGVEAGVGRRLLGNQASMVMASGASACGALETRPRRASMRS